MSLLDPLPDWIERSAWEGWIEARKKIKKPPTERALQLALKKLAKMREEGQDPNEVLDQSTLNSWQDLFPVRESRRVAQQMDTGPLWAEFSRSISSERMPADPAVAAFIQANGGLRRLGEMESRRIEFMRKDFDSHVKSARAH